MFYVIFILFLILISASNVNSESKTRMISSKMAKMNEFPFVIGISNRDFQVFCSGSIVTLKKVITASHCLVRGQAANCIAGTINVNYLRKTTQMQKIKNYVLHPKALTEHSEINPLYDVGIITLVAPFKQTKSVKPIPFASDELKQVGAACKAVGFGVSIVYGKKSDGKLRWGKFKTVDNYQCGMKPMLYCIESKSESVYYGDSGGPLINVYPPYRLYGTCQGGNNPPTYAQYVNSGRAMNWIHNQLDRQTKWRSFISRTNAQSRRFINFYGGIYFTVFVFILKVYNMAAMRIN